MKTFVNNKTIKSSWNFVYLFALWCILLRTDGVWLFALAYPSSIYCHIESKPLIKCSKSKQERASEKQKENKILYMKIFISQTNYNFFLKRKSSSKVMETLFYVFKFQENYCEWHVCLLLRCFNGNSETKKEWKSFIFNSYIIQA